jgi:hypothetical protein
MPNPNITQVHVDRPLTNFSVAYIQSETAFISGQVFPMLPVDKKSDRYFVYTKDDWFRDDAQLRGVGQESAGGGYDLDNTPTYTCQVYAYHKDIDEQVEANADIPLNMERDAVQFVTRKLLLRQEIQWVSDFFTTSKWTGGVGATDITPSPTWDDPTSTPIEDVQAQQLNILTTTGFEPNTLVLGFAVYQKLVRHPDVIDLIKYGAGPGNPAIANEQTLAKVFGVERVLISKAVKNTAAKTPGSTTFTGSTIAGKHALLAYVNPNPGIMQPCSGYQFMWKGISRGIGTTVSAYRIPMPWLGLNTFRIEAEVAWANKLVGADLGCFFASCVA